MRPSLLLLLLFQATLALASCPEWLVAAMPPVPALGTPAALREALRTNGYFSAKTPMALDRAALHALFASHRYFASKSRSKEKDVAQFFQDGRWEVDPLLAKEGQQIEAYLPGFLDATVKKIGTELERQLRAALPEEHLIFETAVVRWWNPAIPASEFWKPDDAYFPHCDFGAVWLNVSLAVYGDGTVRWEMGEHPDSHPGRPTPTGDLFVLTGHGREKATSIPASWHSAPHTDGETERLLFLFYFGPPGRDRSM